MHLNIQNIHSFFRISNLWKPATGAECVHSQLGSLVDLEWNIKEGIMKVSKS